LTNKSSPQYSFYYLK